MLPANQQIRIKWNLSLVDLDQLHPNQHLLCRYCPQHQGPADNSPIKKDKKRASKPVFFTTFTID
jgi:hypothetical protein